MKKIIFFFVPVVVLAIAQDLTLASFVVSSDLVGNVITFLSIIFGFYITSLSIFVTSKYVSSLYKVTDKENKNLTLLHTLFNNYKFGLVVTLISIVYFLFVHFLIDQTRENQLSLSNFLLLPFLGILVNNFLYSFTMLADLIKVILQETKNIER